MSEPTLIERVDSCPQLRRRQMLGRGISSGLGRLQIEGLSRVPTDGPVLLAMNHRSLLDGPLLFGSVRRPINCLVKVEAFTPWVGPLLRSAGQIPVRRDGGDAPAVRLCLRILAAGGVVGIFPEGARGHGRVEIAKPGVGYLGLRSGATIIPVAGYGTSQMAHRRTWRRPFAVLLFGEPIVLERWPAGRVLKRSVAIAATEVIRVALAALVAEGDELRAGRTRGRPTTSTTTDRARD